jgi:5-methylcytosine-specific restriction endonuclease McrA
MRKITDRGLVKKLDDIMRVHVRQRDDNTCQWCGKKGLVGFDSQISHIIPKGRSTYLRWDMNNLILLCAYCHNEKWHKLSLGRKWFDPKYPERVQYLEARQHTTIKKRPFMEQRRTELEEGKI